MISYLKGKVVVGKNGFIILEIGGVGYGVNVGIDKVSRNEQEYELFIHEHIREDADDLYGFLTFEELELFEKLISVNGVGPKAGMNIMGSFKSDEIKSAISAGNVAFFKAVSGIGNKVAAKIILDLKSKIGSIESGSIISGIDASDDVGEALQSLGYKPVEYQKILAKMPAEIDSTEEKVRWCLKNLAK